MVAPGARYLPLLILATLTAVVAVMLFTSGPRPAAPTRTNEVAAFTSGPMPSGPPASTPVEASPPGASTPDPAATPDSAATPGAPAGTPAPTPAATAGTTLPPSTGGLVPGSVDRTSLDLVATYDVNAAITVDTGVLDVSTTLVVRNAGDQSIDRLELNTIAARLGSLRITAASVDGIPAKVRIRDQTLVVPLGGVLQPGASATVLVAYRATLTNSLTDSNWMFTRSGGTVALYRWIPWVSQALPFDRPNKGDPFVLVSSPEVSVEILADRRVELAAPAVPAADITEFQAGNGTAWAFTVRDVRDVSILLAPDFAVAREKVGAVEVRAYSRGGSFEAQRLLGLATQALRRQSEQLGVAYPWAALVAVETLGGEALESPGLIWIPRGLDTLNRTYLVNHEVAHQWFYGLVGNDQRNQPFVDEAAADMLTRTVLVSFRASRCTRDALDGTLADYVGRCYYETIYVQGGLFLDDIRERMGTKRFWATIRAYLEEHRFGLATTRDLLDALQSGSEVDLKPLFRARFPSLY
ncbi:MAG TPA: hypothetical protein VNL94_08050 [Candidatus Binatia bacterium]|nr:hypothetical protein [Candidatus Binatia bacterium]